MVSLFSLVVPIVLSAILVFIASSIIHMLLPFHRGDMRKVPNEDGVMDALRSFNIPPGDYGVPHPGSMANMKSPEFQEKRRKGPVVLMTVARGTGVSMGPQLVLWFLYSVIVSVFAAYLTSRALGPGADYLAVFQIAGCSAFMGYGLALPQHSIWYRRNWGTTVKSMIDSLVYGLLTGGAFGWLWPR